MDRGAWQAIVHGDRESDITEWLNDNNNNKSVVSEQGESLGIEAVTAERKQEIHGTEW